MRILGFFWAWILVMSCGGLNQVPWSPGDVSEEESKRPSDEEEGLPGYIRDPEQIQMVITDDRISVEGYETSVIQESQKPTYVYLYRQWDDQLDLSYKGRLIHLVWTVDLLGRAAVEPNGSFRLVVPGQSDPNAVYFVAFGLSDRAPQVHEQSDTVRVLIPDTRQVRDSSMVPLTRESLSQLISENEP